MSEEPRPGALYGIRDPGSSRRMTLTALIGAVIIAGILHLGRDIFLPLAVAILITFALSPLVSFLRNRGMPMLASVLVTVTVAFAAIGLFLLVVVSQLGTLARQLPAFQANIVTKLEALQQSGDGNSLTGRLTQMFTEINAEIGAAIPAEGGATAGLAAPGTAAGSVPVPVTVVEDQSPFATLTDLVMPLVSPIGTAGLVIVVVIFMLLERDELRDRFIRLVGASDIHRTTQVLEEAGSRVAHYLLAQLLVNTIYAVPIGIGLWLIGVPNALLWGLLTLVLRFVPYIGSILAAAFPLFLAFAVSPDWSAVIWTAALFIVVELITSNIVEPWLYGSRTGVTALAIIVAAIFWTWVWGPMGLVLSTPLTVCLVVLGRHIPQFELFDVMFGDKPVLAPHMRLYQRLLVGDVTESTFRAEEALEEAWLSDYHRDVGLPALLLAQHDLERGVVTPAQEERLTVSAMAFLDELDAVVEEELAEAGKEDDAEPLAGPGRQVAFLGGRSRLDDVAARMAAQAAAAEGARVEILSHADLAPRRFAAVTGAVSETMVLSFLDGAPARGSILQIRRIKRAAPGKRVGVVIWQGPESPLHGGAVTPEKIREILATGADFCVTGLEALLEEVFAERPPVALPETAPRAARRRSRGRLTAVPEQIPA
ncbi:AI-2E family transporter [Pseudogemmobacter humi]|uniref:AI-2 transport protein TqsA n=1 Tax=Pseudogemmobacter humi TaxID=2483812 RepID=A0A3P5X3A9_9RHOB|nr:AI-2E family transporter [Pseudogemmobacter humi]VDC28543.1 AI-2 transport protein TqsA [Pseudogemmobacter humi]